MAVTAVDSWDRDVRVEINAAKSFFVAFLHGCSAFRGNAHRVAISNGRLQKNFRRSFRFPIGL